MSVLGPPGIACTVANFSSLDFQPAQVLAQCVTHQSRSISVRAARRFVRRPQEFLIKDNLDRFHDVDSTPQYAPQSWVIFGAKHASKN
jgi:hypothetical protein